MSDPMSTTQRPTITGKQPGSALRYLEFKHVGPFKHIRYEPAERLNIITGDNSLGKHCCLTASGGPSPKPGSQAPSLPVGATPSRMQRSISVFLWTRVFTFSTASLTIGDGFSGET